MFLAKIFGGGDSRPRLRPLYARIVAAARRPAWYIEGAVADTLDGRFDMVAAMLSLVLLRLEADGDRTAEASAMLTEIFIEDMDGQLREIGIGDVVVGKHLGRMVSALGGRLGAYRDALCGEDDALRAALLRNVYRGAASEPKAIDWLAREIRRIRAGLAQMHVDDLLGGTVDLP